MKRITACLLVAALLLGLTGCGTGSQEATAESTQPVQTTAAPTILPETQPAAVPETEPEQEQESGFLFLTVSRLTFTLAGETEDIYIGTIPREKVTWGTEDAAVATFENGVLTAVGPGETKAFAEYGDQRLECTVGCLAQDQESLDKLDPSLLRTAKRLPPEASEEAVSYFEDAAIIGDSITYIMFQWHNKYGDMGDSLFLCQGGSGINGFLLGVSSVFYQGQQLSLEDALEKSGRKKAFIMLGQNDLGYLSVDVTMENWKELLDRIRAKNPDLEIYLQACVPEWSETNEENRRNEKIAEHNVRLKAFAEENGYHFIDTYAYAVDHTGRMPAEYNLDSLIHLNEAGCRAWMQLLRSYGEYQMLKGEAQ